MKTLNKNINNINGLTMLSAIKKTMLSLALAATVVAANAQNTETTKPKYNRFSVGLKASHLYDVYFKGYEVLNNGFRSEDMQGLKGNKTKFDLAFGLDLTYFCSPIFSLDAGFDMGKMSGANSLNYYESDVRFFTLGGNFDLKGHNRTKPYKFVPYVRLSMALAQFDAKQMLLEDNGVLGSEKGSCFQTGAGLGLRYHISDNFHLNLSSEFVTNYTDAWDGYDYGSGRDYMVKSSLAVRYTFGKNPHIDRLTAWNITNPSPTTVLPQPNAKQDYGQGNMGDTVMQLRKDVEDLKRELNEKLAKLEEGKDNATWDGPAYDTVRVVEKVTTTTTTKLIPRQSGAETVVEEKVVTSPTTPKKSSSTPATNKTATTTKTPPAQKAAQSSSAQPQNVVRNYSGNLEELKQMMKIEMNVVTFNVGSAILDDEAKNTLSRIARVMRDNPEFKLVVNGYCDQDGGSSVNDKLAKRRAQNVVDYLATKGVAKDRMTSQGFGKTALVDNENSTRAKTLNRRVEFVVE